MGAQEKELITKIKKQNDKLVNYKHMKDTLKIEKSPGKKKRNHFPAAWIAAVEPFTARLHTLIFQALFKLLLLTP